MVRPKSDQGGGVPVCHKAGGGQDCRGLSGCEERWLGLSLWWDRRKYRRAADRVPWIIGEGANYARPTCRANYGAVGGKGSVGDGSRVLGELVGWGDGGKDWG